MVVYEVNLEIDKSAISEFGDWLPDHITEVLQCRGFLSAEWFSIDNPGSCDKKVFWTVLYQIENKECLEEYCQIHAPRLRDEGMKRFAGKFLVTRRILNLNQEFSAKPN